MPEWPVATNHGCRRCARASVGGQPVRERTRSQVSLDSDQGVPVWRVRARGVAAGRNKSFENAALARTRLRVKIDLSIQERLEFYRDPALDFRN